MSYGILVAIVTLGLDPVNIYLSNANSVSMSIDRLVRDADSTVKQ
jgi:hypothetical protein